MSVGVAYMGLQAQAYGDGLLSSDDNFERPSLSTLIETEYLVYSCLEEGSFLGLLLCFLTCGRGTRIGGKCYCIQHYTDSGIPNASLHV